MSSLLISQETMSQEKPPPPPQLTPSSSPTRSTTTSSSSKLLMFIRSELFPEDSHPAGEHPTSSGSDTPETDTYTDATQYAARRREKVITFVSIPRELEKLMGYGFFQCADAFLYVFTFLPLRCFYACYKSVVALFTSSYNNSGGGGGVLRASDKCELIKIIILLISSYLFLYIDTNVLYHVIKSQSVIKLYIFFNMLEVGDRLFGCFSQDTLDALFITATEHSDESSSQEDKNNMMKKRKKFSTTAHALICGVSILGHALVILLQSTTLSVAINANNRALLTVMMSNNFVELKGSVFKKFDKMNLFQVSCSDIRERFHLFVLLLIVCLQTLREYSWEESRFWVLLPDCLMVLLAEIVVDWLKHAFITRFNELPLQVYNHYTRSLAYDMAESVKRKSKSFSCDYSDVVGRRLGFVPLPLAIVLIRVIVPMFRVTSTGGLIMLCTIGYIGLASFRILNTIVLVGKAVRIIDEHNSNAENNQDHIYSPSGKNQNSCGGGGGSILKRSRTISGSDGDLLLAMKKEKKLTFVESEVQKDEALLQKVHLLANSNVSLTSVGFNEEMLKVENAQLKNEGISGGGRINTARKHSLGSNLEDERVLMMEVNKVEVKEEKQEEEYDDFQQQQQPDSSSSVFCDEDLLNSTVIEQQEHEIENEDKENIFNSQVGTSSSVQQQQQSPPDSNTVVVKEEEDKKKKKFPWFK